MFAEFNASAWHPPKFLESGFCHGAPLHDDPEQKRAELKKAALEYHEFPTPETGHQRHQAVDQPARPGLAYSPGVAAPCEEIVENPSTAFKYTSRGNLVAVITNGTAVLGLGDIGPWPPSP